MEPLRYLRILRRQWRLLVGMAFVGFVVGFVTTPSASSTTAPAKGDTFLAIHTLLSSGRDGAFTLDQMAYFATAGDVPVNVATKLGGDPNRLVRQVRATANQSLGTIEVAAFDADPDRAVQLADGFASELLSYLDVKGQEFVEAQRSSLQGRLDQLTSQIAAMDEAGANDDPLIQPKREAALAEYQRVDTQMRALDTQVSKSPIFSLQTASAVPVTEAELQLRLSKGATSASGAATNSNSTGGDPVAAPKAPSRPSPLLRAGLGGIVGVLVGAAIALVFARIDPRMHTKEDAQEAFGQPVIAELPRLTKAMQRETEVLSFTEPKSHTAEAFRYLRASIFFLGVGKVDPSKVGQVPEGDEPETRNVILITSSTPAEGKTTTVANLAAVMAESGLSVLVVNCDFRKPRIHAYLGGDPTERKVVESHIPGVWVLNHVVRREDHANPAEIVAAQREVARKARTMFDVVLLDTAPLITTNDVSELIPVSDVVLVIARAGRTTYEGADRAMEVLERFKAPVVGVALVGANETPSGRYYYYYQSDSEASGKGSGKDAEKDSGRSATKSANARSRATDVLAGVTTGQRADRPGAKGAVLDEGAEDAPTKDSSSNEGSSKEGSSKRAGHERAGDVGADKTVKDAAATASGGQKSGPVAAERPSGDPVESGGGPEASEAGSGARSEPGANQDRLPAAPGGDGPEDADGSGSGSKPDAKLSSKHKTRSTSKSNSKRGAKSAAKSEGGSDGKARSKSVLKSDLKSDPESDKASEVAPESKADSKGDAKTAAPVSAEAGSPAQAGDKTGAGARSG